MPVPIPPATNVSSMTTGKTNPIAASGSVPNWAMNHVSVRLYAFMANVPASMGNAIEKRVPVTLRRTSTDMNAYLCSLSSRAPGPVSSPRSPRGFRSPFVWAFAVRSDGAAASLGSNALALSAIAGAVAPTAVVTVSGLWPSDPTLKSYQYLCSEQRWDAALFSR